MKNYLIAGLLVTIVLFFIFGCSNYKKLAAKNIENEELKIRLTRCNEELHQLTLNFQDLKAVKEKTDTIKEVSYKIKEIVVSENVKLDSCMLRLERIEREIQIIKEKFK